MYKPKEQRRWGYFALPILHGDALVGKVDATADREAGVLRVNAVHEDGPFTPKTRPTLKASSRHSPAGWASNASSGRDQRPARGRPLKLA